MGTRRTEGLGKTVQPRVRDAFPRTRLYQLLDRHRRTPVLWIAAPPGAGKTTLVSSYLDARRVRAAWYQIDEGDADIAAFFVHVGRVTRRRGRAPSLPLLRPEHWLALSTFTRRFFAELYRRLPSPSVLVLDNYHEVPPHSRLHDVLADGFATLPARHRVLVLSRHEPPEAFARLRADGALRSIDGAALHLTPAESAGIVRRRAHSTPLAVIRRLHERADGWAAGLVLLMDAASSAADRGAGIEGTAPEAVFDYFAAEAFRKIDPQRQQFLLQTAFLPRMTAALATQLTGLPTASRVLAGLHASHAFTGKRVDGDEPVYEYHPLFREFLQTRARATLAPDRLVDLLRQAAHLLAENGQAEHAALLLREAGDVDGLAALIVAHARVLVDQGRHQTLEEWAGHVPASVVEDHGWLQYWLGIVRTPFAPALARTSLARAYDLFRGRGDVTGTYSAWSGAVGTILYEWSDFTQLDRWIDDLEHLQRDQFGFPSAEIETRVTATMFYALMFRRPEHPEIDVWAERAATLSRTADLNRQMLTGFMLTTYHLWRGQHAKAAVTLAQLRALAGSPDASPIVALSWRVVEAYYHWHMAEPELCLRASASGLELAEESGIHLMDANLLAQGVYGALISGDSGRARELLTRLARAVTGSQNVHASQYHFLMGWDAILAGDRPRALEHARRGLAYVSGAPFPRAWNEIALAIVLHELGEEADADVHLAAGRATGRQVRSGMIEFMSRLAEAEFALDRGRDDEAVVALRAAIVLGQAQGYRVSPWWRPRVLARLCAKALDAGIETAYVQDLVRRHGLLPEEPSLAPAAWPWPVSLRTLGGFALSTDGVAVTFRGKVQQKPLALLKSLVAFGGVDVPEAQLADALWPDAGGDAAHRSFAATLHRLRALVRHPEALRLRDGRLSLDPRHVSLDLWVFERLLQEAERIESLDGERCVTLVERALSLYPGPFLAAEGTAPWALSTTERLRSRFLRASGRLGRHWAEAREWERAIDVYERALAIDDVAEELYQGLMTCHARVGRRAEALRAYARCRRALAATLGVEPSATTQSLARTLGGF